MKKSNPFKRKLLNGLALGALLIQSTRVSAAGTGVETQVTNIKAWLDPILDGIVLIALAISFVMLIIALATKSQDVKGKATYFILALIAWASKSLIFGDWGL